MDCLAGLIDRRIDANLYPKKNAAGESVANLPLKVVGGVTCLHVSPSSSSVVPSSEVVVYVHGNAMNMNLLFESGMLQRVANATNCHVYAPEYYGYGDETRAGASGMHGKQYDDMQAKQLRVVLQAVEASRVILIGRSLGAAIALAALSGTGAYDEKIKGLVLISPFESLRSMIPPMWLGFDSVVRHFASKRFDNAAHVCSVSNRIHTHVVAGGRDVLVPCEQSRRVHEARLEHLRSLAPGTSSTYHVIQDMTHTNLLSVPQFDSCLRQILNSLANSPQASISHFAVDSDSD